MTTSDNLRSRNFKRDLNRCLSKEIFDLQFQDYCSKSSIHGVQYLGDNTRPLFERSWWTIIFLLSFICNGYLIYRVWDKWKQSPVIVSFSKTTTPVWEVPFPAITICLQVNSRKHQFHMGTSMKQEVDPPGEHERRGAMSLLCEEEIIFDESPKLINQSMIDFLIEIAPNITETLPACQIRNAEINCADIFKPVFTEDGLCFTYNVLNHSEMFRDNWFIHPYPKDLPEATYWFLDTGYDYDAPLVTYPVRGFDSGERAGIFIALAGNLSNQDSVCRGPIPGYKIILHNPAEVPFSSEKYIRVPVEQEMLVLVTPTIMTTSPSLRSYSPKVRQCFYPDERWLRYFSVYTERNCELECLTNYTLQRCGCASMYMPRNDDTPICGGGRKNCTLSMAYDLRLEELKKMTSGFEKESCNCLPACNSISYKAETSQATFEWKKTYDAYSKIFQFEDDLNLPPDYTMSAITLFFTDTQFITTHRSELFGVVDFLANIGGLLGLFSGISLLSILEIMYFVTVRYWSNVKKKNHEIIL